MTLREFLGEFDFDYETTTDENGEKVYKLIDLQKANLGNICSEEFYDIPQVLDRLDIYYNDYFFENIENQMLDKGFSHITYEQALTYCLLNNKNKEFDYEINLLNIICGLTQLTE